MSTGVYKNCGLIITNLKKRQHEKASFSWDRDSLRQARIYLRKTEIIEKEIKSLSDETKIYDKIGRLFVLSNKDEICKNLAENHVGISKDLENQKILYKKYQDMVNDHTKHYNEVLLSKKN